MINRQNLTHVEYCKHIDIVFVFLPKSDNEEVITVQHHTSLLGKTQQQTSLEQQKPDEEETPYKVSLAETTLADTILEGTVESGSKNGNSRQRRSINSCEDACYEVSIVHFEISFNLETSYFQINNGPELIFDKTVNFSEILIDRNTGHQILEDTEIKFQANENFFADVPKIRYESIPAQYSSLPKRNIESQ